MVSDLFLNIFCSEKEDHWLTADFNQELSTAYALVSIVNFDINKARQENQKTGIRKKKRKEIEKERKKKENKFNFIVNIEESVRVP